MRRRVFLVPSALLCVAALVPAAAAAAPTGSIAGTVTEAGTGNRVEGIEVCAWPFEAEGGSVCAETDSGGEYEIGELEAGEYEVEFFGAPLNYVTQFWNGKAHYWEADPIVVGSDPVTGIDGVLALGGTIEGTVTEASGGAPVEEAEVCAWDFNDESYAGCAYTEPDGSYALRALPAGEYQIEFWPPGESDLIPQFYDHKYDWSEAGVVVVASGGTAPGINAALEAGAEISGTVYSGEGGAPLAGIDVCAIEMASELWTCTETDEEGHYGLDRFSPGSYKVAFSLDLGEFFGEELSGVEDDGFQTQFWNNQQTLAAADVISLTASQVASGIDARLLSNSPVIQPLSSGGGAPIVVSPPPPESSSLAAQPSGIVATTAPRKRCRKGFVRKKVKGKVRCVKRKKHHRHRRRR